MSTSTITRWFARLPVFGAPRRRHQAWLDLVASSDHLKRDLGIIDGVTTRHHE